MSKTNWRKIAEDRRRALNERQANSPDYLLEYFGSQR